MTATAEDEAISRRAEIARQYFEAEHSLNNQQSWYSTKASRNKSWHQRLGLVVLAAGAGTSLIQIWAPSPPEAPKHEKARTTKIWR